MQRLLLLVGVILVGAWALPVTSAPASYTAANLAACNSQNNLCCVKVSNRMQRTWSKPAAGSQYIRVRRSITTALNDPVYLAKYKNATALLKSTISQYSGLTLWEEQRRLHCLYSGVYSGTLNVHNSWLFFVWHRWFLYFFERTLGNLINDPTFALPAWDWDNAQSKKVPSAYKSSSSPLYDSRRNTRSYPNDPDTLIAGYTRGDVMVQDVYASADTSTFFGGIYAAGSRVPGSVEGSTHNLIHVSLGSSRNGQDMGVLRTAPLDPLFYVHHCNIDRLWWLWKLMPPTAGSNNLPRTEPSSTDYTQATFVFIDYNGDLVQVKAGDASNTFDLGFTYDNFTNDWTVGIALSTPPNVPSPPPPFRRLLLSSDGHIEDGRSGSARNSLSEEQVIMHTMSGRRLAQVNGSDPPPETTLPGADPAKNVNPIIPQNPPDTSFAPTPPPSPPPPPGTVPNASAPAPSAAGPPQDALLVQSNVSLGGDATTVPLAQVQEEDRPGFKEAVGNSTGKRNEQILILEGFRVLILEPLLIAVFIDNPSVDITTPKVYENGFIGTYVYIASDLTVGVKRTLQFALYNYLALADKKDATAFNITFVVTQLKTGRQAPDGAVAFDTAFILFR